MMKSLDLLATESTASCVNFTGNPSGFAANGEATHAGQYPRALLAGTVAFAIIVPLTGGARVSAKGWGAIERVLAAVRSVTIAATGRVEDPATPSAGLVCRWLSMPTWGLTLSVGPVVRRCFPVLLAGRRSGRRVRLFPLAGARSRYRSRLPNGVRSPIV